jgi:O-antigen ligase
LLAVAGLAAGAAVAVGAVFVPARVRAVGVAAALVLAGVAAVAGPHFDTVRTLLASRGNLESSGRTGALQAALDLVREHPLIGAGVGEARFLWLSPHGYGQAAIYAHNEYLQALVDLGAIGCALLLGVFAAIAVTLRRGRGYPHRPGVWAGAVTALAAFAVHSGFDFLWHIAVLPLAGALFVGLAGPAISEEPRSPTAEGEE